MANRDQNLLVQRIVYSPLLPWRMTMIPNSTMWNCAYEQDNKVLIDVVHAALNNIRAWPFDLS